ncbi:MAG: hypothetical protein Q9186_004533 [Xanthomendoza sp. 1 TL-2023]
MPSNATMTKSTASFANRCCHRMRLKYGKNTVHSRALSSKTFEFEGWERNGLSCRKRPLGRPMPKQHAAIARCGDIKASSTSSRGGEPYDQTYQTHLHEGTILFPATCEDLRTTATPVQINESSSSPIKDNRTNVVRDGNRNPCTRRVRAMHWKEISVVPPTIPMKYVLAEF